MTKEEAIKELKIEFAGEYDKQREAKNLAIKALEQQPCEDCINRKDTLAEFKRVYFDNDTVIRCAELVLGGTPPVTPRPKMGRWYSTGIQGEIDGQIIKSFICSECSAISVFRMAEGKIVNGDLCPNCGAKMEVIDK